MTFSKSIPAKQTREIGPSLSLKTKTIILLFCLFSTFSIVEQIVQHFVLLPAFVQLERTTATKNTERALHALDREVELLIPPATDWATWDDSYQFMVDRNAEYIQSNLNLKAMESLKVNLMEFYDIENTRLWGMAYDFETEKELTLGELSEDRLGPGSLLLGNSGKEDTVNGLYSTSEGVFLVASRPVLTSNGDGPSRGRIVIGRLLNEAAIDRMGSQAGVQLRIETLKPTEDHASAPTRDNSSGHTPIEITEGDTITQTATDVLDIAGAPILRFHVETPRAIIAQGRTTLGYASLSLAIAGVFVLLALLIFLQYTVFTPVSLLIRHAIAVGTHDDLSTHLQIKRNDEIGTLAKEFDIMVKRLSETRQHLLEQSFKSGVQVEMSRAAGMAEVATGVLHNVGNVLNSVNVSCDLIMNQVRESRIANITKVTDLMAQSRESLGQFLTEDPRGRQIPAYLMSLSPVLVEEQQLILRETQALQQRIEHIKEIVTMQQSYGRVSGVLETIAPEQLMEDTLKLTAGELARHNIAVQRQYREVPPITLDKHQVLQILLNLINNAKLACDGIDREKIITLRIFPSGPDRLSMQVSDNGVGILPENLTRIFQHGFTTRKTGHGFGLHSGAIAAKGLGGSLMAHSEGLGLGATFTLELPFHSGGFVDDKG